MKKELIIFTLLLCPLLGIAQEKGQTIPSDTTVFIKGRKYMIHEADKKLNIKVYGKNTSGDTIPDDMIYEATYNDEQTTERRFEFSTPFSRNKNRKPLFKSHDDGFFFGYAGLKDGFLSGHDAVDLQDAYSWEIGFNFISSCMPITYDGHWGMSFNVNWGYRSFRLDGNYAFLKNNDITTITAGTEDNKYSDCRLRYNFFRIPVRLEYQARFAWWHSYKQSGAISLGLEPEIRYRIQSKGKINGQSHTLEKNLNVNSIGINAVAAVGYGDIAFYARQSITPLFKDNQGPKMYPTSFGIILFW